MRGIFFHRTLVRDAESKLSYVKVANFLCILCGGALKLRQLMIFPSQLELGKRLKLGGANEL